MKIRNVSHTLTGADPAAFALALEVAYELHAPAPRAPEVAPVAAPRGARRGAAPAPAVPYEADPAGLTRPAGVTRTAPSGPKQP